MENIMETITRIIPAISGKSLVVTVDNGNEYRAQLEGKRTPAFKIEEGGTYEFVVENKPWDGKDYFWINAAREGSESANKGGNGSAPVNTAAPATQGVVDLRQESIELQSSADRILSRFPVFSDFKKFNEKSVREMYCNAAVWGYLGLQDAKAVLAASRNLDKKEDESGGDPGNDEEIPF
jgi:hypothetical protein